MWENNPNRPNPQKLKKWAKRNLDPWCNECGKQGKLELDHIINIKAGGTHTTDNIQWLCTHCHNHKTQKEATKARNAWKRTPEPHPALKHKNRPPEQYY